MITYFNKRKPTPKTIPNWTTWEAPAFKSNKRELDTPTLRVYKPVGL